MSEAVVYAVAGHPVLHSRSPEIFEAGFRAAGISAVYTRLAARNAEEIKLLADALDLKGLNITSPFKETIIPFLDELHPTARAIGAVNVVVRKGRARAGLQLGIRGRQEMQKGARPQF
jgi:shikimate dehydrogenase